MVGLSASADWAGLVQTMLTSLREGEAEAAWATPLHRFEVVAVLGEPTQVSKLERRMPVPTYCDMRLAVLLLLPELADFLDYSLRIRTIPELADFGDQPLAPALFSVSRRFHESGPPWLVDGVGRTPYGGHTTLLSKPSTRLARPGCCNG